MTEIKICGLKREEDIRSVNRLRPEMAGFVFAKKSSRFLNQKQGAVLRKKLDPGILAVGVFADAPLELPAQYAAQGMIDVIQLHGSEDELYIRRLREMTKARIIKAFCAESLEDIKRAQASPADLILLDAGSGGTGETFDWALAENTGRPFLLAGGLTPENVRDAIRRTGCMGVDVSSGVETDGLKDYHKMKKFTETVRSQ